jgi:cytochrome oxidase assembly protein ShyY1
VNTKTKKPLPTWLPLVVGALLVAQFAGLGAWQISRGLEKRADQQMFRDETGFASWHDGMEIRPYQRLKATGSYDGSRQILLENIIVNSRYGYYVLTPLVGLDGKPVLLINRGWIERTGDSLDISQLDVPAGRVTVRGRAGSLPQAGMKMGEAFRPGQDWPKAAVYPSTEEVAAALGSDVQPFRHWVPTEFGPGKHFGYALQWFAMAAVLSGLLAWNYRKRRFN